MSKLTVTMWTTLDGFVAGPNDEMDWILGDEEMSEYELGVVHAHDTLLLGRGTYEDFGGYWPSVAANVDAPTWERRYAGRLDDMAKIVVSRSLQGGVWGDPVLLRDVQASEIEEHKRRSEHGILMYGSVSVVQTLTTLGLIDEYQLLVHPIAIGSGKRLFADDSRTHLQLVGSRPFGSGVVLTTYRPAGEPR